VQATRLEKLINGDNRGNYSKSRRTGRYIKITPKQVIQIKQLFKIGTPVRQIMKETELSEWIVRGVDAKRYDYQLEVNQYGEQSK